MEKVYYDRRGNEYTLKAGDTLKPRSGVFGILVVDRKILVSWPYNEPESIDLPGGGIDPGETAEQALLREIYEETGLTFPSLKVSQTFEQDVRYYAQDQEEFWDYKQQFNVLVPSLYEQFVFAGKRPTPEGGFASWENIDDLPRHDMHHFHRQALMQLEVS